MVVEPILLTKPVKPVILVKPAKSVGLYDAEKKKQSVSTSPLPLLHFFKKCNYSYLVIGKKDQILHTFFYLTVYCVLLELSCTLCLWFTF